MKTISKTISIRLHYAVIAKEGNTEEFIKELRHEYPDIGVVEAEKIYNVLCDHHQYHVC